MKTLVCSKCGRKQNGGKFCLDDGSPLIEKITFGISFKAMESTRSPDDLKKDVRNWLGRIGVQQSDVQIVQDRDGSTTIEYKLLGQKYSFKSTRQNNSKNNLAAVEQFIHHRVIGIERGIETAEQAFAGYAQLPAPEDIKPTGYDTMSSAELKHLLFMYHPDTGKEPSADKFNQVKASLDRKSGGK